MSAAAPTPAHRRVKKRILLPVIVLGLVLVLLLWLYLRGTWADTELHNPRVSAEGPVTQLYRTPEDNVQVRCAILIDAPVVTVWTVVRDYGNHPRFLPYISVMEVDPGEGDRVHLTGIAHSRLWGDWPFDAHVDHKKVSDKEYVASWDEPGEGFAANRGSWTVTAFSPNQTLVVYALQIEPAGYPSFFVRNVLRDRMHKVVTALRDEVQRRQEEK
jgi:uncharacterized membrane protein